MITVGLLGGLGNQMFQYAAALGLAHRFGCPVLLDITAFEKYAIWPYQLDRLKVPQRIATAGKPAAAANQPLPARLLSRILDNNKNRPNGHYVEPHFHFDEKFLTLSGDEIRLEGYFQSPLYFTECGAVVREQFQPAEPLGPTAQEWAHRIRTAEKSVSIHVRRGDYVKNPKAAAVHTALTMSYYCRAIKVISCMCGEGVRFFLFSDEPDYVAKAFADLPRAKVVRTDPARSWEDMFLMRLCQHHIIANSSYSWWGAWLNPSPDKIVIAPGQWFTPEKLATTNIIDLFPEGWIILK